MIVGVDLFDVELLGPDLPDHRFEIRSAAGRVFRCRCDRRKQRVTVEAAISQTVAARRALQFAAGGFRQRARIEQHHHAWRLLIRLGHGLANGFDQRIWREDFLHAAADFRSNADALFAVVSDRERRHAALAHHFDFALDSLLDVLRIEVVSADDEHVFQAPGDEQLARTDKTQVAGAQPGAAGVLHEGLGAGFGVAPVTVGDARAGGPDFADGVVGEFFEGIRFDNQHRVLRLADAAAHDRAAVARLGAVLRQRLIVHAQCRDAGAARCSGDIQGGLGQTVRGHETVFAETAGGEFFREALEGVEADRLGAGIGHAPSTQIEALKGRFADPLTAQAIGEIRAAADGAAVLGNRFQPAQRPAEEVRRRHQNARHAAENRLQQTTDQPHVVVQRQPADDDVVRVHIDAEAATDQQFVGDQIAMADLHTLGQRGGAGSVLQKGDVLGRQARLNPAFGQCAVEGVDAQQRRRAVDLLQGIAQVGAGQQQLGLGVGDDRQQTLLMMTTRGFRRIGRHRNHTGIQATEKRRDVIRATGKQQHRTLTESSLSLQRSGDGARALIEFAIAEHHSLLRVFGEKTQGQSVRRQGRATLEGMDQGAGEFERVGHEVSCLNSACKWNRVAASHLSRGARGAVCADRARHRNALRPGICTRAIHQ